MTLLATVFTSQARMERKVGRVAVTNWADHDRDGESDDEVLDDAINQATMEIQVLAGQYYSDATLAAHSLIQNWATVLACYFLSMSRGNPPPESLQKEFERIMARLERIASGASTLPGAAMKADMRPTWSNRVIDRRYKRNTVRVTRTNSSDAPTVLRQDRTAQYPDD